jgi:hypothetical protein
MVNLITGEIREERNCYFFEFKDDHFNSLTVPAKEAATGI